MLICKSASLKSVALSVAVLTLLATGLSHAQTTSALGTALKNNNLEWKTYSIATTTEVIKDLEDPEDPGVEVTKETIGSLGWSSQTLIKHSGNSAARSGRIEGDSKSILETTVSGKGTLTFWCKVSSLNTYHQLRFYLNDEPQLITFGEEDWVQRKHVIQDNGIHTLKWVYEKDDRKAAGQDTAWLDEIKWVPDVKPALTVTPTALSVSSLAQTITINVATDSWWTASSDANIVGEPAEEAKQWLRVPQEDKEGSGTIIATIDANDGAEAVERTARITVKVYGITRTIIITQAPQIDLKNALKSDLDWDTSSEITTEVETGTDPETGKPIYTTVITPGTAKWFGQTSIACDKTIGAVQSPPVGDGEKSTLQTTVGGPGILTFHWRTSSVPNVGCLRFFINGVEQHKISGETGWVRRTYTLPPGIYTLEWEYKRDGTATRGYDAGWVDQFTWQPLFDVYETRVSARTSAIREMNVKVADDTKTRRIHFRAPVSKSYTIIMAYERKSKADGSRVVENDGGGNVIYTGKGYGRMWSSDLDKAFEFGGEVLTLSGETRDTNMGPIASRGQNIPVSIRLHAANPSTPAMTFEGLATLDLTTRLGRILTHSGVVYGTNVPPAACTNRNCAAPRSTESDLPKLPKAEQGYSEFGVEEIASGIMFPDIYYPQPCLANGALSPAHFVGTFTTRYNAGMAIKAKDDWDSLKELIKGRIPAHKY